MSRAPAWLAVASSLFWAGLLVGAGGLVGCSDPELPYAAAEGDRVTLTLEIGERLEAGGMAAAKELRLALDGRVGADGAVDARILWLELDHGTADRMRTVTSGVEGEVGLSDADTLEKARTRLLDALRDKTVRLRLSPELGLVELSGLTPAFAAAWREAGAASTSDGDVVAAAVDDAALPLDEWFDDARLRAALLPAGLGAVPPSLLERWGTDERMVTVNLPGRGNTQVRATGRPGESGDGRPAVSLEGVGSPDLVFTGDPGPEPPPEIGLPDPASLVVRVETEYARGALTPIRGHSSVSFTYESGYRVRRSTGFTLVIAP